MNASFVQIYRLQKGTVMCTNSFNPPRLLAVVTYVNLNCPTIPYHICPGNGRWTPAPSRKTGFIFKDIFKKRLMSTVSVICHAGEEKRSSFSVLHVCQATRSTGSLSDIHSGQVNVLHENTTEVRRPRLKLSTQISSSMHQIIPHLW